MASRYSSSSTLVHFLIIASIFLHPFNSCSAHNRRMLALQEPSRTPQFGSDDGAPPPPEGDAVLLTVPIYSEEPTLISSPQVPQEQQLAANITPSFFPLPGIGLPSLPNFPPFPFIPSLPFAPGFDPLPAADSVPPPPITEP
ncbi:hypothetical protein CUMW_008120 [Citrus unshiu]|nr:hypothetical protein CUMW_008120 [Citrus unshiu]